MTEQQPIPSAEIEIPIAQLPADISVNGDDRKNANFVILDQRGNFRTPDTVDLHDPSWVLTLPPKDLDTYRIYQHRICTMLGVSSMREVDSIRTDPDARAEASRRTNHMLGELFEIEGDPETAIQGYAETADNVIEHVRSRILTPFSASFEMTNEVNAMSDPVDLLLVMTDDRYHPQARSEAKRKLKLMELAAAIDQRDRQHGSGEKYKEFLDFLNENVWDPNMKIGESVDSYALSQHDPEHFSCTSVQMLTRDEAQETDLEQGQKLTQLKRRRIVTETGEDIDLYVTIREKTEEAAILKLLRKGQENPAMAVEDDLGIMAVLDSKRDITKFEKHLRDSAAGSNTLMFFEAAHDSISGKNGKIDNKDSSPHLQMIQRFIKLKGLRIELILHTNQTYLDYLYQRGTAHDEYEVRRLFNNGVIDLLFPEDIYNVDLARVQQKRIEDIRARLEAPTNPIA